MEAELQSALAEYRAQLGAVEALLAADPDNAEAREVYGQLQEALQYTASALTQVHEQQEQGADEQQQQEQGQQGQGQQGQDDGGTAERGEGSDAAAGPSQGAAAAAGATAAAGGAVRPRGGAPNNARMHPANRYFHTEPDFAALAAQYEELAPYVRTDAAGRAHLDTTSWAASRALTAALLAADFGLRWGLPEGQLVPPVPNRANYLHWLRDLLDLSAPPGGGPVRGLDVGCGANFIYCLLGAVLYGWHMVGVDVTRVAVACCRKLIQDNPQVAPLLEVRDLSHLHPELQVPEAAAPAGAQQGPGGGRRGRKRRAEGPAGGQHGGDATETAAAAAEVAEEQAAEAEAEAQGEGAAEEEAGRSGLEGGGSEADWDMEGQPGILLPAFRDEGEAFAFTMCNPPFFESMQEAAQNPNTAFGGTAAEMVCPGGELAFVLRMLVESEELRERVHWFSTMVGKKSTLKALRLELHSRHVTALRTTELAQGRTSRWAVAWSWQVDPNKASQPLRRHPSAAPAAPALTGSAGAEHPTQGAAAAAAGQSRGLAGPAAPRRAAAPPAPSLAAAGMAALPRRHVSFTVQQAGAQGGRQVLARLQQLLAERGCAGVQADPATWSLSWPLQVGPFSADGPSPAAAAAPGGGNRGGSWASNITVRLRLAQQQRGRVEVVATIPNSAPDAAARAFAALMASLEAALAALPA